MHFPSKSVIHTPSCKVVDQVCDQLLDLLSLLIRNIALVIKRMSKINVVSCCKVTIIILQLIFS